ncbi:MAG TPA: histidine kinase [Gaiellaceae bacterium]|nr:histidine kinase [Gaiellaceae bacterium]
MNRLRADFDAWLRGEILLVGLLGASLALFIGYPALRTQYDLPELHIALQTTIALAGGLVALLAFVRFSVDRRRTDLLLGSGFLAGAVATAGFGVAPLFGGEALHRPEGWAALGGGVLGQAIAAGAPFVRGHSRARNVAFAFAVAAPLAVLLAAWGVLRANGSALPSLSAQSSTLTTLLALQALVCLVAVVGWGSRLARQPDDFAHWLALAFTLQLFAALHLVFTPRRGTTFVAEGDFLVLLAFGLMIVGAWRAIRFAEFGRAVAEERGRVAREIHDGLAQYLFAVSTHAQMLANGAPVEEVGPRLKEAAELAQQEARFAILALSSAGGTAPFDAALRRYIEFLTADGELDVELEVDAGIRLAPDEQIELFRIVQEGLGNVRKHAGATTAEVRIGQRPSGERFVTIRDDGAGFDGGETTAGQGLRNMRSRAESIEGGFTLRSRPGLGTALEVVLRA